MQGMGNGLECRIFNSKPQGAKTAAAKCICWSAFSTQDFEESKRIEPCAEKLFKLGIFITGKH
jgi:hypothetical protein